MADDQEAIVSDTEQETAIGTEATTEQTVADEPQRTDDLATEATEETLAGQTETVEDDLEDLEWNGKTYKAPKGLKDGVLMHADYTKKTQAVSQRNKELDEREARLAKQAEATDEELDARAALRTVTAELGRFKDFDWNAYQQAYQTDPMGAEQAWNYAQHLRSQKAELENFIGRQQTARTEKAQQDLAKRVQETNEFAAKNIKGWKPELTDTLVRFAAEKGIPEEAIKANWSPVFYGLLYEAHIGSQALKRQTAAPKPPSVPLAPLATVTGRSAPVTSGDLGSMDMDAYVAARKRGVGGKALS